MIGETYCCICFRSMFHMFSSITNLAHVLAWSKFMILSLAPITYICCNVARPCFKQGCTWNDDVYGNAMLWPCSNNAKIQGKHLGCYRSNPIELGLPADLASLNNNPKPAWVGVIALPKVERQSSLIGSSRLLGVFKPWLLNVPKAKNLLKAKSRSSL
jgi:hypothetical protein